MSCRRTAHKSEFWRVVRTHPDQEVKLNSGMGRSAYLCSCAECLKLAQKKNRLSRILKAPVPEALYATLWHWLEGQGQG